MQLIFKQRFLSWFDSYDIYDENDHVIYTVKGKLAWGHRLEVYDASQNHVATLREEIFTFLPRFRIYMGEQLIGEIKKEFTFFRPVYTLDCNDWTVTGNMLGWDYEVLTSSGKMVMSASKQLLHFTDTYHITVVDDRNALLSLMIVLAIDVANCNHNS